MIRPACPETRALPRTMNFPWLATLMLGTAVAAFAPAANAQDTAAPAADASGSDATTGEAAAAGDAAATGDAAAGGDAATGDASGNVAATGDAAAAGDGGTTAAAGQAPETGTAPAAGGAELRQAGGALRNADGADVGSVIVTETASGVMHLILDISEGAVPAAQHAIHIHETGACEAPTFESAGGHLAGDKEHGVHSPNGPHLGDLPNITMGAAGALHVEYFLPGVLMDHILDGDGSAVVIHSEVDDYTTQPAGNAGDRIACGVLEPSS